MSLIRACKILNIKSVDVQHGHQCKHPMYLYWLQIPITGYDLLPDYYWVWSNFATKELHKLGHEHVKTVHGPVDCNKFKRSPFLTAIQPFVGL